VTDESGDMGGDLAKRKKEKNRATMCQGLDQSSCSEWTNVFIQRAIY